MQKLLVSRGSWISKWLWSALCPSHPDSHPQLPCSLKFPPSLHSHSSPLPDISQWPSLEAHLTTVVPCHLSVFFSQCLGGPHYMAVSNFDFSMQSRCCGLSEIGSANYRFGCLNSCFLLGGAIWCRFSWGSLAGGNRLLGVGLTLLPAQVACYHASCHDGIVCL